MLDLRQPRRDRGLVVDGVGGEQRAASDRLCGTIRAHEGIGIFAGRECEKTAAALFALMDAFGNVAEHMRFDLSDHQCGADAVGGGDAAAHQVAHIVVAGTRHHHVYRRKRIFFQVH